jgi:hypothetical protein
LGTNLALAHSFEAASFSCMSDAKDRTPDDTRFAGGLEQMLLGAAAGCWGWGWGIGRGSAEPAGSAACARGGAPSRKVVGAGGGSVAV